MCDHDWCPSFLVLPKFQVLQDKTRQDEPDHEGATVRTPGHQSVYNMKKAEEDRFDDANEESEEDQYVR